MNNISVYDYNLKNFTKFLKKNILFCIIIILTALYIYGIKIFNPGPEVDSVAYMTEGGKYLNWREIGRYGLIILQRIWQIEVYNPIFSSFFSVIFLIFAVYHWCYLFYVFSLKKYSELFLIASGLLIVSSAVWVEMFYFSCMAAECAFMIFLCPFVIWLTVCALLENSMIKISIAILLVCAGTSVYQSFIIMFCTGALGCVLLIKESLNIDERCYCFFILKGMGLIGAALILYFMLDRFFVEIIFKTSKSSYLTDGVNRTQGIVSFFRMGLSILSYFLGNTPIFDSIIEANAKSGVNAVTFFHDCYWHIANILYFPLVIAYIVVLFKKDKDKISGLKIVVGFLILLVIVSLNIIARGRVPVRSLWAFPIGLGFLVLYTFHGFSRKKISSLFAVLFILISFRQAQKSAMLFYSDHLRYQQDLMLSNVITRKISDLDIDQELPLLIIGAYRPFYGENFKQGEVIGHSVFGYNNHKNKNDATGYGCAFLNAHGLRCRPVLSNDYFIDEVRKIADFMPCYPTDGYIKKTKYCIVIKLSETTFKAD